MQNLTDEELIQLSRAPGAGTGDDPYVNELFTRYRRRVALWCLRFANDRDEAADMAQEILATAWRKLDTFEGRSRFSTWLFTLCRNRCLNAVRARAVRNPSPMEELPDTVPDMKIEGLDDALVYRTRIEAARGWIRDELDPTERRVMVMHFAEEMPLDTITRVLGLTNTSGAKAYVVSARRKLTEAARKWKAQHERPAS